MILGWFFLTAGLSAFLLFFVQPMVTMALLPLFGGGAYIWNAAQVFFQFALLAGYSYAFGVSRMADVKRQLMVHGAVSLAALLFLPLSIDSGGGIGLSEAPVRNILLLLVKDVGLPFFLLSSTASLLQYWLARGFGIEEPYGLYRASNAGSFFGLLSYPLLVQPFFRLEDQMLWWSVGFVAYLAALGWCARKFAKGCTLPAHAPKIVAQADAQAARTITLRDRMWWLLLAFGPVSLLMAVNTHIGTDIPSFPLIWVLPLALYLLSFVWGFARWHRYVLWGMLGIQAVLVTVLIASTQGGVRFAFAHKYLILLLVAFFFTALVCHHELFRRRPPKERLTEYYLFISLGGFIGGIFNVLLVPVLFPMPIEMPLMVLFCTLIRPDIIGLAGMKRLIIFLVLPLALFLMLLVASFQNPQEIVAALPSWGPMVVGALVIVTVLLFSGTRLALLLVLLGLYLNAEGRELKRSPFGDLVYSHRNFYGVARVYDVSPPQDYRALHHGTTLHGVQAHDPHYKLEPVTYYHRSTPLSDAFFYRQQKEPAIQVGLIGVGTGNVQCYARPEDTFRYFEIDRDMVTLATNPEIFTYLTDCPGQRDFVVADGRIGLSQEPDGAYDIIVADAFSSDSIPIHLLTAEAVSMYMQKLKPGGLLLVHVSNRYMDLSRVVGGIAQELGLQAVTRPARILNTDPLKLMHRSATWIVVAKDKETIEDFQYLSSRDWNNLGYMPADLKVVWRDNYASLLSIIRW